MNTTSAFSQTSHPLDLATLLTPIGDGVYRGKTSTAYANMIGPFGGLISAVLLNAAWIQPARLGEPVALTVNFTGPIADGEFTVTTKIIRTNRSTQHWYVELTQGDQVGANATAVFALRRETWSATEVEFPGAPAATTIQRAAPIERAQWTSAYDMRFVQGNLDLSQQDDGKDSVSSLWIRDEPPRSLDFISLAALCDAFFPRIFIRRPRWVPASTVSLTTYFHTGPETLKRQHQQPLFGTARAHHFGQGYFDQTAQIWSEDKILLATSHQVVYFKE
jgi:hypothetical protein